MRIFISQPMYDKTDEEIKAKRHEVEEIFGSDAEIIDSFVENVPRETSPLWYLGEAIKKLDDADIVYFCKDWQHYRGCVIEHECAVRYGLQCVYE